MKDGRVCSFWVDDILMGIDVIAVAEVVRDVELVPVPLADPSVSGLLNLRGRLVTAVDVRHRLDLPAREPGAGVVHIIVPMHGEWMSLVVDHEGGVLDLLAETCEAVPETIAPAIRRHTTAAHQLPAGLLLVLDPDSVLAI